MTARPPLVLFHASCMDGAGAAAAAFVAFGEEAEYRAVQYGQPPPTTADVEGRRVYILDFSYKRAELLAIAAVAEKVAVLDHHKTAEAELRGLEHPNLYVFFDLQHSGAVLAWNWLHSPAPAPRLLQYIEDRDLWRWQLPESRAVSAALASHGYDFRRLARAIAAGHDVADEIRDGNAILRAQQQQVDRIAAHAYPVELDGARIFAVNSPLLQSEIGEAVAVAQGTVAAVWFWHGEERVHVVSLRSRGEAGADVSEIAKRHGGGGHAAAAGFSCAELPWRAL